MSSNESAALGGTVAHPVNFLGTDTVMALVAARRYYDCEMAGFSIPAAEHSTITGWGTTKPTSACNMQGSSRHPALFAVVSDSYDIFNACDRIWGTELKELVERSGATLVVRPTRPGADGAEGGADPGGALRHDDQRQLAAQDGAHHPGDGIDLRSLRLCLLVPYHNASRRREHRLRHGRRPASALRNRDTMQWAMKCSAMQVDGQWREVYKQPVGDASKASKKGRLTLAGSQAEGWRTVRIDGGEGAPGRDDALQTVFENGEIVQPVLRRRARAAEGVARLADTFAL